MSTPQSEEQVKANECNERQEEMDAIAGFANHCELPSVAGAFTQTPASANSDADTALGTLVNRTAQVTSSRERHGRAGDVRA